MEPQLTIIIPVYNRAKVLKETLQSIREQTFTAFECLVVDDGSTDGTIELVGEWAKQDDRFILLQRPQDLPKGANSCRNLGFSKAKGQFINWFDSDDLMVAEHYLEKINMLQKHPSLDAVVSGLYYFDEAGTKKKDPNHGVHAEADLGQLYLLGKFSMGTTNPVWRRSTLEGLPSIFDPTIFQSQDLELHARLIRQGIELKHIDKPLFLVRKAAGSISGGLLEGNAKLLASYIEVRRRILAMQFDAEVMVYFIKQLLFALRIALGKKEYRLCTDVFLAIEPYKHVLSKRQLKQYHRAKRTFNLVRLFGFGETRLKRYLTID